MRELIGTMVRLFKNHCVRGLFTMKLHLLHHLCDDLENSRSIQYLDAGFYEHAIVVLKSIPQNFFEQSHYISRNGLCIETRCRRVEKEKERWSLNRSVPRGSNVVVDVGIGGLFSFKVWVADKLGQAIKDECKWFLRMFCLESR